MPHNITQVSPIEKIIAILSYITMGIVGLLWLILAHFAKKKLRYFLMYNISQSMIIAIILAILKLTVNIILSIASKISFLDFIAAKFNWIISLKILRFYPFGISFTIIELFIFILLAYIIIGVVLGRIFYIPSLSVFMQKVMKSYK